MIFFREIKQDSYFKVNNVYPCVTTTGFEGHEFFTNPLEEILHGHRVFITILRKFQLFRQNIPVIAPCHLL